jgi:hypothetical protein
MVLPVLPDLLALPVPLALKALKVLLDPQVLRVPFRTLRCLHLQSLLEQTLLHPLPKCL